MQFRPCIDIHKGKVKQIIGGSLNEQQGTVDTNFVSEKSSAYYARMYQNDQLRGGHVIMLDRTPETKQEALQSLKSFPNGLQIGGGITDQNAKEFLNAWASHVIVSSYIFENGKLSYEKLEKLIAITGKDRLVLDLSCRKKDDKYIVVIDRWQTFTNFEITIKNLKILSKYCSEFLIHGVDSEGKKQGIEKGLLETISLFNDIPITYAGGIRNFEDIKLIEQDGKGNIHFTIGSALDIFGGNLEYEKVIQFTNNL